MTLNRVLCSAVVAALFTPAVVMTAEPSPKDLQHARHEHYEELGDAFKVVRDQTRASSPDFAAIKTAAKKVTDASVNQEKWFPAGTGPEAGKTRALPVVWTKADEFTAAQKMFSERAPKLLAAVKAKDAAGVQAAFREVGGSCKNCHDTFRAPEE